MDQFLKVTAKEALLESQRLYDLPNDESTPYENKYKGRDILESLLKNPYLFQIEQQESPFKDQLNALKGIICLKLAINFMETEENASASIQYGNSLSSFQLVSQETLPFYSNSLQELYNNHAFLQLNRDQNQPGLESLQKAEDAYKQAIDIVNLKEEQEQETIHWHEGGVSQKRAEELYTLTMFYLAQAYTKLEDKEKAALYCGWTMQRQQANKTYQVKEWAINCLSLSEYYIQAGQLTQARYILDSAMHILPQDKHRKLKASLSMLMARIYLQALKLAAGIKADKTIKAQELKEIDENSQKTPLQFNELAICTQQVTIPMNNIEEAKQAFRIGNTLYKKALDKFILDGYVTEHITIQREVSSMYQCLGVLDDDTTRQYQMEERRKLIISPLVEALNPKAYMAYYQQMLNELIEINSSMYDNRYHFYFVNKVKPFTQKRRGEFNLLVEQMLKDNQSLFKFQFEDKDTKDKDAYQSLINAQLNIAKAYGKFITDDKTLLRQNAIEQLNTYKWIHSYILNTIYVQQSSLKETFQEQENICNEMVQLLPAKIQKLTAQL